MNEIVFEALGKNEWIAHAEQGGRTVKITDVVGTFFLVRYINGQPVPVDEKKHTSHDSLTKAKQVATTWLTGVDSQDPVRVLAGIADAYDANELDDEARKYWGSNNEHQNAVDPDMIILYQGRGGKTLLTLGDCLRARDKLKTV